MLLGTCKGQVQGSRGRGWRVLCPCVVVCVLNWWLGAVCYAAFPTPLPPTDKGFVGFLTVAFILCCGLPYWSMATVYYNGYDSEDIHVSAARLSAGQG